jgi:hypothetical protein
MLWFCKVKEIERKGVGWIVIRGEITGEGIG